MDSDRRNIILKEGTGSSTHMTLLNQRDGTRYPRKRITRREGGISLGSG